MELPRELQIWNGMKPEQRYEIMQKVGSHKSLAKWQRACLKFIKANF